MTDQDTMFCFLHVDKKTLKLLQAIHEIRSNSSYKLMRHLSKKGTPKGQFTLVVDIDKLSPHVLSVKRKSVEVSCIPLEAVCNINPYRPPRTITAGGGYVIRPGDVEPEVLLIYRKGAWDLPKGKQDAGESIEACSLREVREEVGINVLYSKRYLGQTLHGYAHPRKAYFMIKTTHWYWMTTTVDRFTPQREEGIEAVEWVPWSAAISRITYPNLIDHMHQVTPAILGGSEA